jgi:hypothetical protein
MQWILQEFEDTHKLSVALDRMGISYSLHKVVPFVGELTPEPEVPDPKSVVIFGAYSVWRYAEAHGYWPGVFKLRPFIGEAPWKPYILNGPDALFLRLREIPARLADDDRLWFLRPVEDSKELPGTVKSSTEILEIARKVLALDPEDLPQGSLRHDTLLMLCRPVRIQKEWRTWVVRARVVTYSLYKEGNRVVYRREIDDDALAFAHKIVDLNPDYSTAYVLDVCRTEEGLKLLETNCINSAGFYDADLMKIVSAIEAIAPAATTGSA